jgi:RNA polymerase sigma-70 factor (ECF subfamily)
MNAVVGGNPPYAEANAAMERYAAGDDSAFGELYDAVAPKLLGHALRQTNDRARAEDFVQQTLLQMHRMRGRFIVGADVMPWAFAILRRLIIDGHRKTKREVLPDDAEESPGGTSAPCEDASADELVHAKQLAATVEDAVERLPESLRVAFVLVRAEGLDAAEAGQVLGLTANAVKIRVHRACEALRSALGISGASI